MSGTSAWMVYGAYGYTGRRVVRELVRRGHHPLLAGRDAARLTALAESFGGLPTRAFDIDRADVVALAGCQLFINAAGPFVYTAPVLAAACIAHGCHYLDIANESDSLRAVYRLNDRAADAGVVLLPGAGFGTTLSSCLVERVVRRLPDTTEIDIVLAPNSAGTGAGTQKTMIEGLRKGAMGLRNGTMQRLPLRANIVRRELPFGRLTLIPAALGDAEAAYYGTGVGHITAHVVAPVPPWAARFMIGVIPRLLQAPGIRGVVQHWISKPSPSRPEEAEPSSSRSYVWVAARDRARRECLAWLSAGEGYRVTAEAMGSAAAALAAGDYSAPGAHTAATAFGGDFLKSLPGVSVHDG